MAVALLAGSLYRRPVDAELAAWVAGFSLDDPDDAILADERCRAGMALMQGAFTGGDSALKEASADYHRLFVGPDKLKAAPWGSVYLDRGNLFGPTTFEVERLFKEHGFDIPEGRTEPVDHMAYELAFLAEANRRLAADPDDPEAFALGAGFLSRYLRPWAGELCARIERGARTDVYRGLASLTRGLVDLEAQAFGLEG